MIELRDVRPEDKEKLRNWRNLSEIARFMNTDHIITPEEHEEWFQGMQNDTRRRYWIIARNQEDLGLINLYDIDPRNKRCYISCYLANSGVRGKGIGSLAEYMVLRYVFDELHFNKLGCEVLSINHSVIKLQKSFGFVQEGRFRQHIIKGNQLIDVFYFSLLREEWKSKRKEKRFKKIEARLDREKSR